MLTDVETICSSKNQSKPIEFAATGAVIEDLLFSLNRDQGITLIIVTHDPDLAARCTYQLNLKDGRLDKNGNK